jgi:hypothetical protein
LIVQCLHKKVTHLPVLKRVVWPGCNIALFIDLHCRSQSVDSVPHCSARSGNRSRITNVTISPPLLRAHNIRKAPSYSETSFAALPRPGPGSQFECTSEYHATARHTAVMHVHGGANLNCTFQIWAIFSHPCTVYRQLKFCVQSLLVGLCKRAKFRVTDKDHSLVSQGCPYPAKS